MKKTKTIFVALLLIVSMCLPHQAMAQAPEKMSYQTIVRNASNNLVVSTAVGMQISILQTTAGGTAVYVETHASTTNANGLVSVEIGGGIPVSGTFVAINWSNGPYFVKTEIDPSNGTNYTITGTSQLLSVPYAMHAKSAESIGGIYTIDQRNLLSPYTGLVVYNSTTNKPNYYNGTEWMNYDGTLASLTIGIAHQGGIIAYILQPGDPGYDANETHGIIAAPSDQSTAAVWGCYGQAITTSSTLGTGATNTANIVGDCGTAGVAASICNDLELGGYNDWFLPSIDELEKLYNNRVAIGGFANSFSLYWSSSQNLTSSAWNYFFIESGGGLNFSSTDFQLYVRAIRYF